MKYLVFLPVLLLSACSLLPREKVLIYFPQDSATVGDAITIEGRAYDKDGIDVLRLSVENLETGGIKTYSIKRLASVYKGKVLEQLSKFRQQIRFASGGAYRLTVMMKDSSGNEIESAPVTLNAVMGKPDQKFILFSRSHVIPLIILILMNIFMVYYCRRYEQARETVPYILGAVLWGNEIVFHLWHLLLGSWTVTSNLMIHMCGLAVLLIPVMLLHPSKKVRDTLFPMLYFWGFGGAVQALLTPDIGVFGYPSYRYFAAFISHGFIVTAIVYMVMVRGYYVTFRMMYKVYGLTILILIPVYGLDQLIKLLPPYEAGSYFFLLYPPVDGSAIDILVDIFGPSPRYIIGLMILSLIVFHILVVPFRIAALFGKKSCKEIISAAAE